MSDRFDAILQRILGAPASTLDSALDLDTIMDRVLAPPTMQHPQHVYWRTYNFTTLVPASASVMDLDVILDRVLDDPSPNPVDLHAILDRVLTDPRLLPARAA